MSASDLAESASPSVVGILGKLGTDPKTGLNSVELQERLSKYGPNALPEDKKSVLSGLLAYFWGPIPWMIEAAALMALIVGDWGDLTIITSLLLFNALLGFWEEHEASNALDALKNSLALKARVLRSGKWEQVDAQTLVPGDIVRLYLGDVVPGIVSSSEAITSASTNPRSRENRCRSQRNRAMTHTRGLSSKREKWLQ